MYRRYRTAENQEKREKAKAKEIVDACWKLVEEQCKNNEKVRARNSSEEGAEGPWRIVRVFVSSTFTDFFCEREVLVKKVFPELREWCEERNIRLVECDLRWGVPKDTDSEETIQCCLEELDWCHAETNGCPFFINLLGERYGWIPEGKDLSNDLKDLYMWVPNTSITFMEILHGAYRSCNPNAVFFFRNSDVINDIPEDFRKRFVDKEILNKCHLKELKKQLKIKFPNQVFDYDCKYSGVSEKAGRKRVILEDLDKFAEKTLIFFKSRISQFYPDSNTTKTENDRALEDQEQIHFMERKSHFVIGQDVLIDKLLAYAKGEELTLNKIEGEQTAFVRDPEFWKCEDGDNLMVCLSGAVGQGKTSLLAKLVKRALKVGLKVFYHFVGISENSVQKNILLKRLAEFLKGEQIDIPEDTSDVTEFCMKVIKEEFAKLRQKENQILIVLDGMNELADRDQYKHLSWLPPRFPGNVRAIVSTSSDHLPTLHRLKEHTCFLINIPQLKKSEAKEIIAQYLIMFNKKLDNDQMDIILSKPSSLNPLWLTLLAEQLRTFGDFRTLNQHIQSLSDSVDGLLEGILRDLVANDDSGKMEKALSILALTQGLPEIDMQNILGDMDIQEPIPALYWSKIRRALKPFTYMAGVDRNIRFIHGAFYENIEKLYLNDKKAQIMYHTVIVDYLMSWCANNVVKRLKVPFHCQRAELYDKLVDFIHHSESAAMLGDYMRSMYLQSARCMQIADPVLKVTMPVVLCRGCSNAYRGFKAKHFPLNKDACVICGTHVFGHKVSEAYLCLRHSQGQSKLLGKCRLCDMAIRKDENGKIADFMGCPGKLCMHCSSGIGAKRCSYIGKRI
ncbi:TPR repeat-containing protein DDB_G0287407-like [Saccostrea cucullata]|uniref:TPR repeat-containing protein DDB_G0287407-like n=1 Tax=Saccostrea cuccullata TaxID=36930 RepID=UPI002ED1BACE